MLFLSINAYFLVTLDDIWWYFGSFFHHFWLLVNLLIFISYSYFPVFVYYVYDYGFYGGILGHLHHQFTLGHFNFIFLSLICHILPYFTFICHLSGLELF